MANIIALLLQLALRFMPNQKQIATLNAIKEKIKNDKKIDAWIMVGDGSNTDSK